MRKIYSPQFPGQDPASWAQHWQGRSSLEDAIARIQAGDHYLSSEFERCFGRGGPILEAGCGRGEILLAYRRLGCEIIGCDFDAETLAGLREHDRGVPLVVADVRRLPFCGSTFGAYYSGGVMEHFEAGPQEALVEARRVLRDDGLLLISVPHVSMIRGARDLLPPWRGLRRRPYGAGRRQDWRYRLPRGFGVDAQDDGFHEYAFKGREFARELRRAGFRVLSHRGCSVRYGARDLRVLDRLFSAAGSSSQGDQSRSDGSDDEGEGRGRSLRMRLMAGARRLAATERAESRAGRALLRVLGAVFGHLHVYVCTPR